MALSSKVPPPIHAARGPCALFYLRNRWIYVMFSYLVPSLTPSPSVPHWAPQMDTGHHLSPCLVGALNRDGDQPPSAALSLHILSMSLPGLAVPLAPHLSSLLRQPHSYCFQTISLLCVTSLCISARANACPLSCHRIVNLGKGKGEEGKVYSRWKCAV